MAMLTLECSLVNQKISHLITRVFSSKSDGLMEEVGSVRLNHWLTFGMRDELRATNKVATNGGENFDRIIVLDMMKIECIVIYGIEN